MLRRFVRPQVAVVALALMLVCAPMAYAYSSYVHTFNYYTHGIKEGTGQLTGNYEPTNSYYYTPAPLTAASLWSYGYHLASDGSWQQQCGQYVGQGWKAGCSTPKGNFPCSKWGWNSGDGIADLDWHGHKFAGC